MYIYTQPNIHVYTHTYTLSCIYIYTYSYTYTYTGIHIYRYIHIYIYTQVYIYINIYIYKYKCICISVYKYKYVYIYIYMYIHIYIYIYIRINTVLSVCLLDHHPRVLLKRIRTPIGEFSPSVKKNTLTCTHFESIVLDVDGDPQSPLALVTGLRLSTISAATVDDFIRCSSYYLEKVKVMFVTPFPYFG